MNPVEMFVVYATQLLGYLYSLMLRIFMIVVILMPFFGLIRHARREPGVGEVSQVSGCELHGGESVNWMYWEVGADHVDSQGAAGAGMRDKAHWGCH